MRNPDAPADNDGHATPPALPSRVEPYTVVADIDFAEGPSFDAAGNLYFVNYLRNGTIGRKTPDGTVSVWCETGGQANGLKVDAQGWISAADYGGKRVLRIHPDGQPIQPLSTTHGDWYADYSHGVRLVGKIMLIDGEPRKVAEVLRDPELSPLLCDEGALKRVRYRTEEGPGQMKWWPKLPPPDPPPSAALSTRNDGS